MTGERIPELERVGQTSRTSIGGNQKGKRGKDMKTFKKVLASALAAAMVVTAFPVTNAEAATAPKLSTKKATIYVGQSKTIKVTLPKGAKITSVKTSKKAVATVKKSGKKVVVKAVKAGKATVTVKVTPKKGKAKSLKATITVKNPTLSVKAADVVAVGATEQIKATVKPANTKVTYTSDNAEIATVDEKGLVTGVKAGDVTITVKAGKTTKTVKMAVKDVILKDIKQTTTTKLAATIVGNTANVKASDIVITNTYSKANFAVKSVTVDKNDKTQVTVETYVPMNDGKDYTVTLADVTKTITVTDGKIVAATISPATVVVPTPDSVDGKNANDVSAKFTDAKGVEIATVDANATTLDGFAYVEWKVDATNNGYISGKTLNLYKVGNTAKITVIAHTGKYNASAVEEGNVTAEATITGVAPEAVTTTGWSVKLGTSADKKTTTEFKNVKEAKVAVKDTDVYAYIQRTESNGKTANASTGYTFESSDIDVMTVGTTDSIKDATAIAITPYKAGNAYIIVKDAKTKAVVTTLPVTVVAERKVTTLTLDNNTFTLSSKDGIDTDVTVKVTAKDQYGEDSKITSGVTCKNANSKAPTDTINITANEIKVNKPALVSDKDTSNTYIVEYKDVKVTFTIVVKKVGDKVASYDLSLSKDKADAVIKADAKNDTTIDATVWGYDSNGVKFEKASTGVTWSLEKDGKAAKDAAGVTTGSGIFTIQVNDISNGKQMAAGVYTLKAEYNKKVFVKTFEVTNSQPAASASLTKTEVNGATDLKNILKVVYDGNEVKADDYSITSDVTSISKTTNIPKITVKIKLATDVYVEKELEIGKTVVVK